MNEKNKIRKIYCLVLYFLTATLAATAGIAILLKFQFVENPKNLPFVFVAFQVAFFFAVRSMGEAIVRKFEK